MANYIKRIGRGCCCVDSSGTDSNESSQGLVLLTTYSVSSDEPTRLYFYNTSEEMPIIRGVDMFDKIKIDGSEVSVADIDSDGGMYNLAIGTHTINFTLKDGVISVPIGAFFQCTSLTNASIPNSVTSIEEAAFNSCSSLTNIIIPSSVTSIGEYAFQGCSSLASVTCEATIPSTLGYDAFDNNASDCKIYVPCEAVNAYKTAPTWLKYKSKIRGIDCENSEPEPILSNLVNATYRILYPEGIDVLTSLYGINNGSDYFDSIQIIVPNQDWLIEGTENPSIADIDNNWGWYYFNKNYFNNTLIWNFNGDCRFQAILKLNGSELPQLGQDLVRITIPNTVTALRYGTFDLSVQDVTIPDSVYLIEQETFHGGEYNKGITITLLSDYPPILTGRLFSYGPPQRYYIYVPNNAVNIYKSDSSWSSYADHIFPIFQKFSELSTITVTYSVSSAGLTQIYHYNNNSLEDTIVRGIDIFETIKIDGVNVNVIDIDNNEGKYNFEIGNHTIIYTLRDGTENIPYAIFAECETLRSVNLPNMVGIFSGAFGGCINLTSISIPNTVYSIGGAFMGCSNLTTVTFEEYSTLGYLGENAFSGCTTLESITIPHTVTHIGQQAFSNCTNLTSVTCLATTPPSLGTQVFSSNASNRKIYVPSESVDAYKVSWSTYAADIEPIN